MDKYKNVRIQFDLRDSDNYVASLNIKDGHINVNFAENVSDDDRQILSNYFSENIPNWENFTYTRDTGGVEYDSNGALDKIWDGVETISFSKNPYETLMYIFASQIVKDKRDRFNMRYIITLKTPPVITQS